MDKSGTPKKRSPSITSHFVAVCDVLGFRHLIRQNRLEDVLGKYERLVLALAPIARANPGAFGVVRHGEYFKVPLAVGGCHYAVFSDTVLLWSKPISSRGASRISPRGKWAEIDPNHSLSAAERRATARSASVAMIRTWSFLAAVSSLVEAGLAVGVPVRGGVAYGPCVLRPSRGLFVGAPIVDAYETEQRQEWIGAACHPSCEMAATFSQRKYSLPLRSWHVPVKPEPAGPKLDWAVEWGYLPEYQTAVEGALARAIADAAGTPHETKWRNTVEFWETWPPPQVLIEDPRARKRRVPREVPPR